MIPLELVPTPARVAYACGVIDAELGSHFVRDAVRRQDYEDLATIVMHWFWRDVNTMTTQAQWSELIVLLAEQYEQGWTDTMRLVAS